MSLMRQICIGGLAIGVLPWAIADASVDKQPPETRLVCTYSRSLNLKTGESSSTIGKDLVIVQFQEPIGAVVIRVLGEGERVFTGAQSRDEIQGTVSWGDDIKLEEDLKINRYTGEFTITFSVNNSLSLIHYGDCKIVEKPKF